MANSALSLYYYVRVVVPMWITDAEPAAPPLRLTPAVAAVLIVAVAGTIVLGVYPRFLFDSAAASAASLAVAGR